MRISITTLILSFLITSLSWAREDDFHKRVEWVGTLKTLFIEIERESDLDLTTSQIQFKKYFNLIDTAWANTNECFFAGWPSEVRVSGGKKFCTSPLNLSSGYESGSCKSGELQCQPSLFGKNICVSFSSPSEKSSAFSKCDQKFKSDKRDHSFLKDMGPQEANDLQNLSVLAHKVCEEGSVGIQKGTSMCKNLMDKFDDGMLSIARSQRSVASSPQVQPSAVAPRSYSRAPERITPKVIPSHEHDEDCPAEHLEILKRSAVSTIQSAKNIGLVQVYENLKRDFQNSPHCRAENVLDDPSSPNSLITKDLISDLGFLDYSSNDERNKKRLDEVLVKYKTSESGRSQILSLFSRTGDTEKAKQEIRRIALQDYAENAKMRNPQLRDVLEDSLAKNHIFTVKNGKPECPFMSQDAFNKAFEGMEKVKNKSGVSNKNLLTIVDYTQPSNSRRLYVIDLANNKVMHNTWVAHGGGQGNVFGSDGIGGSPQVSNRSGSNLSSDGFVVAGAPSYGARFGNNLILNGVDRDNSNMRARAVIMHGWDSPGEQFVNGIQGYKGGATVDVRRSLKNLGPHTSKSEFDRTISDVRSAAFIDKILRPTEGCLGVPKVSMPHLDPKGRNQTMINVLRQDLAGTVIFNYSGQDMKSNYF